MKEEIEEIISRYKKNNLTYDEYVHIMNECNEIISIFKNPEIKPIGEDHVLLNWGRLGSWDLKSEKGKELSEKYCEFCSSSSKDINTLKDLICKIIDECNGVISEDWGGKYLTKKEAKEYIMNYRYY